MQNCYPFHSDNPGNFPEKKVGYGLQETWKRALENGTLFYRLSVFFFSICNQQATSVNKDSFPPCGRILRLGGKEKKSLIILKAYLFFTLLLISLFSALFNVSVHLQIIKTKQCVSYGLCQLLGQGKHFNKSTSISQVLSQMKSTGVEHCAGILTHTQPLL